jgi:Ca2+-binding RTX toxin-like protein
MGSTDSNTMTGGTGDDLVYGDAGNDVVYANQGKDTAYGEAGDDTFYVSALVANQPTLVDGGADSSLNNGGGDTLVLQGLTSGSYSLSALAGVTNTMEILNIRGDSANTALNVTSADIRAFVDGGNASRLVIKADSGGDSLVINTIAGETVQTVAVGTGATDYLVFNAGVQVAQIHWQAA